ncbi:BrnT family toxin [Hoeflea ulvae]|uniref:BrnT family toxin n=1 Tax=Hoeflea ulvae TaxID=2983764 RepID=A0ABT3YAC8_9HYPH|nr:BrnT family toxin [Hoeflea ulvae]MCY0092757.1 BrnT family toxin [Hoeflea ulvae]
MEFEWDETKRAEIYKKHGVDLLEAALIFENEVLEKEDTREDYGERRLIALGMVDNQIYIVVYTKRDAIYRLITAWKGGRRDREEYEKRKS